MAKYDHGGGCACGLYRDCCCGVGQADGSRPANDNRPSAAFTGRVVGSPAPLNALASDCHATNQHWWHHPATGERLNRNKAEMIALMHSELSEMLEGERKNLMDSHLPHRKAAEVEMADLLIRAFDYAGAYGFDLDGAVAEKRAYNATRADHKREARMGTHGKAF